MIRTRDFRPDAVKLARIVNARARRENKPNVVELDADEFVHIHCGDVVFIVFRHVITAGSMYFESALFGLFKEAYSQEIAFAEDVDPEALELYLNLTHSWFFEIRFRGIRVVPVAYFRSLIEPIQEEPFKRAHLEIPKLKLRQLAEVVTLADRFLHRSLLCILRQMFLTLLNVTHESWNQVKQEARDMDVLYHAEFVIDYTDTFEILSTGHDDEKYLRNALTESFYWLTLNTPDIGSRFMYLMSDDFIAECDEDRRGQSETEQITHAKGIFVTDQFCYESITRVQKQRRFKRVVNMCPFEDQKEIFPWVENPRDRRIRVRRLHESVRDIKRSARDARVLHEKQLDSSVPGAASHQVSILNSLKQSSTDGGKRRHEKDHLRGAGRGRGRGRDHGVRGGQHQLPRGSHRQGPASATNLGTQLNNLEIDPTRGSTALQRDDGGLSSTVNHQLGTTKSAPQSSQAVQRSSVGLNPEAQPFQRPSQMESMISSIRTLLYSGKSDALNYLEKQGNHAGHNQHQGQSQCDDTQPIQNTLSVQTTQSGTPKTQKNHAQQTKLQQVPDNNHQSSSQKRNKYRKKKKHQMPGTEQNTGKPDTDTITSPLNSHTQDENAPRFETDDANAGIVDVARDAKHGDAPVSTAPEASSPMTQIPSNANQEQNTNHVSGSVNDGKGRSRYGRKNRGYGREKVQVQA